MDDSKQRKKQATYQKNLLYWLSYAKSFFKEICGNTQGSDFLKLAQTSLENIVSAMQVLWGKNYMASSFLIFLRFSEKSAKEEHILEPG